MLLVFEIMAMGLGEEEGESLTLWASENSVWRRMWKVGLCEHAEG